MKAKNTAIILTISLMSSIGCKKFLDAKPDKQLVVPESIQDAQALMNKTDVFTFSYPASGEIAAGDFYLLSKDWESLSMSYMQRSYIWGNNVFDEYERNDWSSPYVIVYNCNVILDALNKGDIRKGTKEQKEDIRGQALFYRSYAFYSLLQLFAKAYDSTTSKTDPGVALRLSSDFNVSTTRSTVAACYQQIIEDSKKAANLLAENTNLKTRPAKAAAYAFLSRVYLNIGMYEDAISSADSALYRNGDLIDYNSLDPAQEYPFSLFNQEVIFHTRIGKYLPSPPSTKIVLDLVSSYNIHDLRKSLFLLNNGDGTYSYRGSYVGNEGLFCGLATDELYLIRAECYARLGNTQQAMRNLNALLGKRFQKGYFSPLSAETSDEALNLIIQERRKELLFRGLRWSDLKRLNKDPRFAVTLKRIIDNNEYILPPNDNRYLFPIPSGVIAMTGIEQNPR